MIRVAVIGTGNISTAHIEGYLAFPERCQIVALCDIFPEKAQAKKEKYQLNGADVVDDHEKLLDREDIDLVSVCTPPCSASLTPSQGSGCAFPPLCPTILRRCFKSCARKGNPFFQRCFLRAHTFEKTLCFCRRV